MLQILNTGLNTAADNMSFDEKLLETMNADSNPILHLYQWARPSATFGYFIRPENHLDLAQCRKHDLDLARRPTGGGIVFHIWDMAFSFLLPSTHKSFFQNPLENYRFVNSVVLEVIQHYFNEPVQLTVKDAQPRGPDCHHFCMAKPTQYDVVYQGMKVAGSAQRKKKQGYLHQGTIALCRPNFDLLTEVLLSKTDVLNAMRDYSYAPLKTFGLKERQEIEKLLADKLSAALQ